VSRHDLGDAMSIRPHAAHPPRHRFLHWPRRGGSAIAAALALVLLAGSEPASADENTFDALARTAARSDLPTEIEALIMRCDEQADDFERRQCEVILRARQARARRSPILVTVDPPRVVPHGRRAWTVVLPGCLLCATPPILAGKPRRITTSLPLPPGPPRPGDVPEEVRLRHLGTAEVPLTTEADRAATVASLHRLRTEVIVKLRAPKTWSQGDVSGVAVEALAWRVLDPCSGKVYISQPPSAVQLPEVDNPICKANKAEARQTATGPVLPDRLTASDIERALAPVREQARACFRRFRVRGRVDLGIDIRPDGTVRLVRSSGPLVDTPSANCVRRAALQVRFPAFRSHTSMHVTYAVMLR
jgi:hypothetical protein